jgi:predicted Zn-dependent protease
LKDVLKSVDRIAKKFGDEYVEVSAQNLFKIMLTPKEVCVEAAKQGIKTGAALCVLVKRAWGFTSVGALDAEPLAKPVSDEYKMARAVSSKLKTPIMREKLDNLSHCVFSWQVSKLSESK